MLRKAVALFAVLALSLTPMTAYAESQAAQVLYEASATVVYVDGETETTQKVPAGSTLKEPDACGLPGYTFVGWKDQETGSFWAFDTPVERNLTLVACYEPLPAVGADLLSGRNEAALSSSEGTRGALPQTGDRPLASVFLAVAALSFASLIFSLGRKQAGRR